MPKLRIASPAPGPSPRASELQEGPEGPIRTRMPFNVPHDGSTLLEFENVADQLMVVYSRFVQDGKIDA